jgi:hypothetical protein
MPETNPHGKGFCGACGYPIGGVIPCPRKARNRHGIQQPLPSGD